MVITVILIIIFELHAHCCTMYPPVKGTIRGHGPVGLDLAGQVPQNCETVQGFKSNGLRQKKGFYLNFSLFNFSFMGTNWLG